MLTVTSLTGDTEPLINYKDLEIEEEVNGAFTLSLTSFFAGNNPGYDLLQYESIVECEDHEFRIKQMGKTRKYKSINSPHIFFDLNGHQLYDIIGGTKTVNDLAPWILAGTGWTFEVIGTIPPKLITNFGQKNAVSLIRDMCSIFECEVKIMPNKHLIFVQQIGEDNDFQLRYNHNIKTFKEEIDTTNLRTVIKGFGANGLEVTYTSPNASIFGEIHADPIRDDRFTQAESLLEHIKQQLNDTPKITIEIEETALGEEKGLGDKVWLIYEPLEIELQTRVMARRYKPYQPESNTVTLSSVKKTFTDVLTETKIEIDENKQEYRSRIEQTNDRITLEVEAVNQSIATIDIKADNIILSVEAVEQSVAAVDIKADNITLSVSDLGDRVDSAEASINIQSGLISSKVEKNGVISAINQSSEYVEIDASKINLMGITHVADTLTIGDGTDTFSSIRFNGNDSWIHSNSSGLMIDTIGVTFAASSVDFGTANIYNLKGYTKNYTGQSLQLWRSSDGTKIRVYQDGYYSEFSASAQG